jgi:hypothetical protein
MIPNRPSPTPTIAVSSGIPAAASAPNVRNKMTAAIARLKSTDVSEACGDSASPPISTVIPALWPVWAAFCWAFVVTLVSASFPTL